MTCGKILICLSKVDIYAKVKVQGSSIGPEQDIKTGVYKGLSTRWITLRRVLESKIGEEGCS